MLRRLSVENYALIDKLEMELGAGLNIITGETGAGKSILLGALGLLLGNRNDGAADGGRNCVVEGVFDLEGYGLEAFFDENDLDYAPSTVIRRVIAAGGKSRAYVNDLPVQVATLKELGTKLIDIHSQHQNLMLSDEGFRTRIVDGVAGHGAALSAYSHLYNGLRVAERALADLRERAAESRRDEEYIRFQSDALSAAALREGETEELEAELAVLSNAGQIIENLSLGIDLLDHEEGGVLTRLRTAQQALDKLSGAYPRGAEFSARIHSTLLELKDLCGEMSSEAERIEADPARAVWIDERLGTIYGLLQKHRVDTVEELIALNSNYLSQLSRIEGFDEEIAAAEKRVAELHDKTAAAAAVITRGRQAAAKTAEKSIVATLGELGIANAQIDIEITPAGGFRPSGCDAIRFLFSANKNNPLQPVEKVASGGEISRLSLSIKALVAKKLKLPTIIFDEIDTGVSGRTADAVGNIIALLSGDMQVVAITHLPQVASKGGTHFVVYKDESGSHARTRIAALTGEERVGEIAKMLSGSSVTDAALAQARLLLASAK